MNTPAPFATTRSRFLPADFNPARPVAVIAGRGLYPQLTVRALRHAGVPVRLIAFVDETAPDLVDTFPTAERETIKVGQLGHLLKALRSFEAGAAFMAGQIRPRRLFEGLHPDWKAIAILASLIILAGDTGLAALRMRDTPGVAASVLFAPMVTAAILAVLLVYVWGDEFWFRAYNVDDAPRQSTRLRDVLSFHPASAWFGIVVFLLGLFYKKFCPHSDHEGFPGYFLFLTLVALTPSVLFFPVASPFINWRAFRLGLLFILLVSLFWEATIAVPYQWWGFQDKQMLGMFINGFCGLPVEEPLLWLGVTWATVIIYEMISTLLFI